MNAAPTPRPDADDGTPLSPDDQRRRLTERRDALRGETLDGVQRSTGEDRYSEIASEVPDAGDASVASEQSDLRHAQIDRDVNELRAIDAALARLDEGRYGVCTDCDQPIPAARLVAEPTARRCIRCQSLFEARQAVQTGSTL